MARRKRSNTRSRKTAVHVTNAEVNLAEAKADAHRDYYLVPTTGIDQRSLLPTLAEWRAAKELLTERELLERAQMAATLELIGSAYAEDRLDVAADIVRVTLLDTGGAMPRGDSLKVTLTAFCDLAKTRRRSIDRQRARDNAEAEDRAAQYALTESALGIDSTPARHAAIVARSSARGAELAASAACELLNLPADIDSPTWSVFYQWARGETGEACAAERGVTWASWKMRQSRGAKFIRGFYSAPELARRLTLGARTSRYPMPRSRIEAGTLLLATADLSREAPGNSGQLADAPHAPHWREGTDHGRRPEAPETAAEARSACNVSKCHVRPKRERERAKGTAEDRLRETATARRRLGRAIVREARRRERAQGEASTLGRALVTN